MLHRHPWLIKYRVTITVQNAARQYCRGRLLLTTVNAVSSWLFLTIQWQTIQVARGVTSTFGGVFSMPVVIVFIIVFPSMMIALIVWWATGGQ